VRYQPEHKAATRRRLVESAVTAFRRDGVDSAGLKEIMSDLGLTVGGFYRHFASKSDLVQAAVSAGLQQSLERMRSLPGDDGLAWLERFAAGYLSETHRRSIDQGCVLAALGADIARGDDEVRECCEEGLREVQAELRRHVPEGHDEVSEKLWALMALEVGGLLLSRMVASDDAAAEILASCRRTVKAVIRGEANGGTYSD
jgi:TetR/AcrR family transcriptional repressor of nem operon